MGRGSESVNGTMLRACGAVLLCALVLFGWSCVSVPRPSRDGVGGYHDLMIRARKQIDGRMKGGRIVVKIQARQGMILFLTPLNQVALKLEVADGGALLFNPRRKNYWQGSVGELMEQLWDLPMNWDELVMLLLEGRLPPGREALGELKFDGQDGRSWREAELSGPDGLWRFSVVKRSYSQQTLPRRQERGGWTKASLREVAGDEQDG